MAYEYKNQYNVNQELSDAIAGIITVMENNDYVCKVINIEIPEHEGMVRSYVKGNPYEGSYEHINGAQWNDLIENYSTLVPGKIDKQIESYFIVMSNAYYNVFEKISYMDLDAVEQTLKSLCEVWAPYEGILDVNILVDKFPYLKPFFAELDQWREKNDRVLVDDDILEEAFTKVLSKQKPQK